MRSVKSNTMRALLPAWKDQEPSAWMLAEFIRNKLRKEFTRRFESPFLHEAEKAYPEAGRSAESRCGSRQACRSSSCNPTGVDPRPPFIRLCATFSSGAEALLGRASSETPSFDGLMAPDGVCPAASAQVRLHDRHREAFIDGFLLSTPSVGPKRKDGRINTV
jgi:hypothetical protein